jgi:hypothetical protein
VRFVSGDILATEKAGGGCHSSWRPDAPSPHEKIVNLEAKMQDGQRNHDRDFF